MKTLLTLSFLLFCAGAICQKKTFYYSGHQKVYLQEEPGAIFIKMKYRPKNPPFIRRQPEIAGATVTQTSYDEVFKIRWTTQSKASLVENLRQDTSILYHWDALTLEKNPFIATGHILVHPKSGIKIKNIVESLQLSPIVNILRYDSLNYGTEVLSVNEQSDLFDVANKIYETGLVDFCHPDFYVPVKRQTIDPYYMYMTWFTNQNYGVNIEGAWPIVANIPWTVNVVVVDDGIAPHEDISRIDVNGFTPRNTASKGAPGPATEGHGEGVAGIIGADANNSIGVVGVFQGVGGIKSANIFYDNGETISQIASAINYAWNNLNAHIITNSWNFSFESPAGFDILTNAINEASTKGRGGKGCPVVFSAGNSSGPVWYPANVESVYTVGAIEEDGSHRFNSATGPLIDFVAVAGTIQPTTDLMGSAGYSAGNYTNLFGNTSGAAPQVTGVIANMLSVHPGLTNFQIRSILRQTARDHGAPGRDDIYGEGTVNGCRAAVLTALERIVLTGPSQWNGASSATYQLSDIPPGFFDSLRVSTIPADMFHISKNGSQFTLTKRYDGRFMLLAGIGTYCNGYAPNKALLGSTTPVGRLYSFSATPVPANTTLHIQSLLPDVDHPGETADIKQVSIVDKMGNIALVQKPAKGTKQLNINVAGIRTGNYILFVDHGRGETGNGQHIVIGH